MEETQGKRGYHLRITMLRLEMSPMERAYYNPQFKRALDHFVTIPNEVLTLVLNSFFSLMRVPEEVTRGQISLGCEHFSSLSPRVSVTSRLSEWIYSQANVQGALDMYSFSCNDLLCILPSRI